MGDQEKTGLEARCCDAIHLRHVYHHFKKPQAMQAELLRALKPGRLIAVIDFEPDSNHGIKSEQVRKQMTEAGFEFIRRIDKWEGRSSRYLLLFRRPL
jgi:ubiquinone/menaquinone biosynthesis C-methylase UbiE